MSVEGFYLSPFCPLWLIDLDNRQQFVLSREEFDWKYKFKQQHFDMYALS